MSFTMLSLVVLMLIIVLYHRDSACSVGSLGEHAASELGHWPLLAVT